MGNRICGRHQRRWCINKPRIWTDANLRYGNPKATRQIGSDQMKIPFDNHKTLSELDHAKIVAANMIKFGGGFAKMLGTKLAQMDIEEIEEFKKSWSGYYRRYSEMAEVNE